MLSGKHSILSTSTETEWVAISREYEELWNFPNCVGTIDVVKPQQIPELLSLITRELILWCCWQSVMQKIASSWLMLETTVAIMMLVF